MPIDGRLVRQVALYVIDNHTCEEAAQEFGLSLGTIKKYLKLARDDRSVYYNESVATQLSIALASNSLQGKIKGGTVGARERIISKEQAIEFYYMIETKTATLRELAEMSSCSPATVLNAINALTPEDFKTVEHEENRVIR